MQSTTDTYYASALTLYPIGDRRMLLVSDELGPIGEIDRGVGQLLSSCRGCRTIDQHAAAAFRAGLGTDLDAVRSVLTRLIEAGLIRSGASLRTPAPDPVSKAGPVATVAIVTADRPALLRRCLASLSRHCSLHGSSPRVLVVDGSRDPGARSANAGAVANLPDGVFSACVHIGPPEAEGLRRHLADVGVPETLTQFALQPGDAGSNRNLALLASVGEDILMLDDDVLCEPWTLPVCSEHLALGGHLDEREIAFFETREDAVAATSPSSADLLALHGRLLSRSLLCLVDRSAGAADLTNACPHLLSALANQETWTVRATVTGIVGDAGIYTPDRLLFSSGPIRERLCTDRTTYLRAMRSREVMRIARKCAVTHEPRGMTYAIGLSNRLPLPPFMPIGRNEDGVFSALLGLLDPTALFANLPVGIVHDSDRPSAYRDPAMLSATQTRLSEILIAVTRDCMGTLISRSPEDRWKGLSGTLLEIATLPARDFVQFTTGALLRARSDELRRIDGEECPDFLSDDLDRYQSILIENVSRPDFFQPIELGNAPTIDEGFVRLQAFIGAFGTLLGDWHEIRHAAGAIEFGRHGAPA